MIAYGKSEDSLIHGRVELAPGLNFIENAVKDTTAVWNLEENRFYTPQNIITVDGRYTSNSNIPDIKYRQPICVEDVRVHVLAQGWVWIWIKGRYTRLRDLNQ